MDRNLQTYKIIQMSTPKTLICIIDKTSLPHELRASIKSFVLSELISCALVDAETHELYKGIAAAKLTFHGPNIEVRVYMAKDCLDSSHELVGKVLDVISNKITHQIERFADYTKCLEHYDSRWKLNINLS